MSTARVARPANTAEFVDIAAYFASHASAVDQGQELSSQGIAALGAQGLLDLGAPGNHNGELGAMSELVALVAEESMASAFSLWAHRMAIEYLHQSTPGQSSASAPLIAYRQALIDGTLPGVTAMAAAVNYAWGHGQLGVRFERQGDEVVLNGRINWASNLFADGFLVVTAAQDDQGQEIVVAVPSHTSGVEVQPYPELLALNATASSSLILNEVRVSTSLIITEDLRSFLAQVRGPFLLLQASFALGIAKAALRSTESRLGGLNEVFINRFNATNQLYNDARAQLAELTSRHDWRDVEREVLALRLEASGIAEESVHLEARVHGGAAYFSQSATARRLREVAFLPIQSPTEALLRHELACLPSTT
ncbi:MAG: acyl-CoA dehydrogenase family protein [Acidimicrobiia bacterium]